MVSDDRSAARAARLEEAPTPFRSILLEHLSPRDAIHLLAFNPSYTSQGVRSPATLLALTDRGWLLVSDDEGDNSTVVGCDYSDTLLLELTEILLYGQLKIDFAAGGESQACTVEFNTVMDRLYRAAVWEILRGIESEPAFAPAGKPTMVSGIETWPIAFRNAVAELLPRGRCLTGAVQWPAVFGGFRRELAPAAALLITDRDLLLISEEKAWVRGPRQAKYGHLATYFPIGRLASFGLRGSGPLSILDLEMHASHGGETLQVLLPAEREREVIQVVEYGLRI